MAGRTTLPAWLRAGGRARIAAVLRTRPDVAAAVDGVPAGLVELASRLAAPHSVHEARDRLDLAARQALDAVLLLGDGADPGRLAELLAAAGGARRAGLDRALALLGDAALVWPSADGSLRLTAALRATAAPGFGSSAAGLLAALPPSAHDELAGCTGLELTGTHRQRIADLAEHLADPDRIAAALAGLTAEQHAALVGFLHQPVRTDVRVRPASAVPAGPPELHALGERGLVLAAGGAAELPREVAVALRGAEHPLPFTPDPPEVPVAPADRTAVDGSAGLAALGAVQAVGRLLELAEADPPGQLRTGGVGVRELRRLASTLGVDEPSARLWLEIAVAAGLLAPTPDGVLPTEGYDHWRAADPADRLVPLLVAWWELPEVPGLAMDDTKPPPALARQWGRVHRELRHGLLRALRADVASRDPAALAALVHWERPRHRPGEVADVVHRSLAEAELLGLVAGGARSALGTVLADVADRAELGAVAARLLPAPVTTARVLPDLMAVVAGTPSAGLAAVLDRLGDRESRDTASTWRIGAPAVRRALDGGATVDGLLAELAGVADGAVPQPVAYLIRDTGRRHGELRVTPVACCVLGDPALVAEVAADRSPARAGLRALAPTVLASPLPPDRTLALLRDAGYAPVQVDAAGTITVARHPARRARGPVVRRVAVPDPPPPPAAQLQALAERLLWHGVTETDAAETEPDAAEADTAVETDAVDVPAPRDGPVTVAETALHLRRHAPDLGATALLTLARAVDAHRPVRITYMDGSERATDRVVEPLELAAPVLVAWCRLREDERSFLVDRIAAVEPVE